MLTIKHIADDGDEHIYLTSHVNYVPSEAKTAAGYPSSLWRYDETGRAHEFTSGMIYVMNDRGTTVARYDLTAANNQGISVPAGRSMKIEGNSIPA